MTMNTNRIHDIAAAGPEPTVYVMPNLTGQPLGSAMLARLNRKFVEPFRDLVRNLPSAPAPMPSTTYGF